MINFQCYLYFIPDLAVNTAHRDGLMKGPYPKSSDVRLLPDGSKGIIKNVYGCVGSRHDLRLFGSRCDLNYSGADTFFPVLRLMPLFGTEEIIDLNRMYKKTPHTHIYISVRRKCDNV